MLTIYTQCCWLTSIWSACSFKPNEKIIVHVIWCREKKRKNAYTQGAFILSKVRTSRLQRECSMKHLFTQRDRFRTTGPSECQFSGQSRWGVAVRHDWNHKSSEMCTFCDIVDAEWWCYRVIPWYHVMPRWYQCDTIWYHVIPCDTMRCHVLPCVAMWYQAIKRHVMLCSSKIRRLWQVRRKESPRPNVPWGSAVEPLKNRELWGWRSKNPGISSRGSEWFRMVQRSGCLHKLAWPYRIPCFQICSDKVVYIWTICRLSSWLGWWHRLKLNCKCTYIFCAASRPDNMIQVSWFSTRLNFVPRYQDMSKLSKQLKTSLPATAWRTMLTCRSTRSLLLVLCQRRSWTIGTSPCVERKHVVDGAVSCYI